MSTFLISALLVLAAAPGTANLPYAARAKAQLPEASSQASPSSCKPAMQGEEATATREIFEAIRNLCRDGAAGVPKEAQALLDQMTAMYENDDSRGSAEMADAMREFAGGNAPRRQRCSAGPSPSAPIHDETQS